MSLLEQSALRIKEMSNVSNKADEINESKNRKDLYIDSCMQAAHEWAQAAYCKALNRPGFDIDASREKLQKLLNEYIKE